MRGFFGAKPFNFRCLWIVPIRCHLFWRINEMESRAALVHDRVQPNQQDEQHYSDIPEIFEQAWHHRLTLTIVPRWSARSSELSLP